MRLFQLLASKLKRTRSPLSVGQDYQNQKTGNFDITNEDSHNLLKFKDKYAISKIKDEAAYIQFLFGKAHRALPLSIDEKGFVIFGVFTHSPPQGRNFKDSYFQLLKDDAGRSRFLILYKASIDDFIKCLYLGNRVFGPTEQEVQLDVDFIKNIDKDLLINVLFYNFEFFSTQRDASLQNENELFSFLDPYLKDEESKIGLFDKKFKIFHIYDNTVVASVVDNHVIENMSCSSSHELDILTRFANLSGDPSGFIF